MSRKYSRMAGSIKKPGAYAMQSPRFTSTTSKAGRSVRWRLMSWGQQVATGLVENPTREKVAGEIREAKTAYAKDLQKFIEPRKAPGL